MANYLSRETKVIEMELWIVSFIADNNLPLSLVDNLTDNGHVSRRRNLKVCKNEKAKT